MVFDGRIPPIFANHVIVDVSGTLDRGVNIPNLNIGISIGIPESKETILHQWGRVGRNRDGAKFYMVLQSQEELEQLEYLQFQLGVEFEEFQLNTLGHPFQRCPTVEGRLEHIHSLIDRVT
jgi:superfamily II DNA/RNA helicase